MTTTTTTRAPGCNHCWNGWLGYDDRGRYIPCTNCRPSVPRQKFNAAPDWIPMPADFRLQVANHRRRRQESP